MYCSQRISGITFLRYPHSSKNRKPKKEKSCAARKSKGRNRIPKIGYCHLYLRKENLRFNNDDIT